MAFQLVGAPWLDARSVGGRLRRVPGVDVIDTVFTPHAPTDGKYDGQALPGLRFHVTDREAYDPTLLGLALLAAVRDAPALALLPAGFDRRLGSAAIRERIMAGEDPVSVRQSLREELAGFRRRVEPFLLYR
jgi:uncharacterized protein YbbC (DUF1343 family)